MNLSDQSIARLARDIPGATRVFREYALDFCCGGKNTLREAARERGLDAEAIAQALVSLRQLPGDALDWAQARPAELVQHIVARYHARHREQLPELIHLAQRVEDVHGKRADCPAGLAEQLRAMRQELESHMLKEEQILFPLLSRGRHAMASGPIAVMEMEHEQHGAALARLLELTDDITLPRGACNTWRALYGLLAQFRDDLMEHIHLENNILFVTPAEL
jgi:regulator of cell morphogenesis and NO signaling